MRAADCVQPFAPGCVSARMEQPITVWPRGGAVGALLAGLLLVPVIVVMGFDCAAGDVPSAAAHRFVRRQARSDFFAGRLAVQAALIQRDGAPGARDLRVKLRLENRSAANLAVDIVGVLAPWGDVPSEPRQLILAPHQSSSTEAVLPERPVAPGSTSLGVALRVEGRVESQQLLLNEPMLAQAGD